MNTSPLLEPGRDQHVVAEVSTWSTGGLARRALCRSCDSAGPRARIGATKMRASSICVGFREGGGEGAAALEEEAGDAAAAELGEGGAAMVRRRRGSRRPRRAARRRGRVGVGRGDDEDRRLVEGARGAGSRAAGGPAVEDDAERLAGVAGVAGGEQRVVGEDGADADRDRVGFGAPAVDQLAARARRRSRASRRARSRCGRRATSPASG